MHELVFRRRVIMRATDDAIVRSWKANHFQPRELSAAPPGRLQLTTSELRFVPSRWMTIARWSYAWIPYSKRAWRAERWCTPLSKIRGIDKCESPTPVASNLEMWTRVDLVEDAPQYFLAWSAADLAKEIRCALLTTAAQ